MSVYQNNNGELIPIAGGKAEYGASTIRKGTFSNPAITAYSGAELNITFDTPMPDNDYIVEFSQSTLNSLVTVVVKQNSKTTTGFTVLFSRPYSAAINANQMVFTYTAFKLYTDTEYNSILEGQRYSTDEVDTGKVWIDGKKIYRRVLLCTIATPLSATGGWTTVNGWTVPDTAIEKYISIDCSNLDYGNRIDYQMIASSKALTFYCLSSNITIPVDAPLIIEYTKTT